MIRIFFSWLSFSAILILSYSFQKMVELKPKLIGHRGGVVDSTYAENSFSALEQAYKRGYYMVEIDVRLSKDGQLITQHDPDFKKYYDVSDKPQQLNWEQIKKLRNNKDGGNPLLLEDVFKYCNGKMQVMIDNKITGNDTVSFGKIEALLRRYGLINNAMMIGTEETRRFFLTRSNTGFSRSAIETMEKAGPLDLKKIFLFEHGNVLTKNDIDWARQKNLLVVPSINKFHYTKELYMEGAARDIANLQQWGVQFFQIDSEFDKWLK